MKGSGFVRIVMVVMFIAGCAHAMAADRSVYWRLASTHRVYYSSIDDAGETSDVQYSYCGANSMLLGSATYHAVSDIEGETTLAYNIQSSITNTPSGRKVDYIASPIGDGISAYSQMYVFDSMNRVVHSRHIDFGSSPDDTVGVSEVIQRYNDAGYADSTYCLSQTGNETFESCVVRSFSNSMLSATTIFYKNNGDWLPSNRYLFTYPSNPIVLPVFIWWNNLSSRIQFEYINWNASAFNPKVIPSEIISETWDNGVWIANDLEHIEETLVDGVVRMTISSQVWSGSISSYADQSGNIICVSEGWTNGTDYGTRTLAINWDSIMLDNDEEVIAIDPLPCAYPNPFKVSTKIRLDNYSKFGAKVTICNLRGQLVREFREVWGNEVYWDGKDEQMQPVPSGVYLLRYEEGQKVRYGKLMRY